MAEGVSTVAPIPGLSRLSDELLDVANTLKSFREKTKDASSLIQDISFELGTIASLLIELNNHREQVAYDAEVLGRLGSQLMVQTVKIRETVGSSTKYYRVSGKGRDALRQQDLSDLLDSLQQNRSGLVLAITNWQESSPARPKKEHDTIETALNDVSSIQSTHIQRTSDSTTEIPEPPEDSLSRVVTSDSLFDSSVYFSAVETSLETSQLDNDTDQARLWRELSSANIDRPGQAFSRISANDNARQINGNVYNVTYNITYNIRLPDNKIETLTQVIRRLHLPDSGNSMQEDWTPSIDDDFL